MHMTTPPAFSISPGFQPAERAQVAALYWEAFGAKLRGVLGPTDRALSFIADHLDPDFGLVARDASGVILGVAGFKTAHGALISAGIMDVIRCYGWLSSIWRLPLLALVERGLTPDELLMDGICVTTQARGMGVGTALLNAIKSEAGARGLTTVRLDVIDTNPRARALYEREGFAARGQENLGPLSRVFGFRHATRMVWTRSDAQ